MKVIVVTFVMLAAFLAPRDVSLAQEGTNRKSGVSVTFVGFTNINESSSFVTYSGPAAVFSFTNASPQKVYFQITSVEYKSKDSWIKTPPLNAQGIAAGVGFGHSLSPSSVFTKGFRVHDTNVAWRIQVFCVEEATGIAGLVEEGKEFIQKHQSGKNVEILSGRKYVVTGQTLSTSGQPVGAANGSQPSGPEADSTSSAAGSRR